MLLAPGGGLEEHERGGAVSLSPGGGPSQDPPQYSTPGIQVPAQAGKLEPTPQLLPVSRN